MASISLDLNEEMNTNLSDLSKQLNQSPAECVEMALNLLMQYEGLEHALQGVGRVGDGQSPIELPAAGENEAELKIAFHNAALEELQQLDEEDQIEVLSALTDRVYGETEEDLGIDLIINENNQQQTILSSFDFGHVVYTLSEKGLTLYLIGLAPELEEDLLAEDELAAITDMAEATPQS
jgi:hypothetical protein